MMLLSDLWKLIRRKRKRYLTVAPMPLPEAIPVEEAEVAAIFAEFDVLPSTEPTTTTRRGEEEVANVTQQLTAAYVTTAINQQHRQGTEHPLTVIAERGEPPSLSGPSLARVVVIGIG